MFQARHLVFVREYGLLLIVGCLGFTMNNTQCDEEKNSTVSTRVQDALFCPKIEHQKLGCVLYMGMRLLYF